LPAEGSRRFFFEYQSEKHSGLVGCNGVAGTAMAIVLQHSNVNIEEKILAFYQGVREEIKSVKIMGRTLKGGLAGRSSNHHPAEASWDLLKT
jgi:hypothetical protein